MLTGKVTSTKEDSNPNVLESSVQIANSAASAFITGNILGGMGAGSVLLFLLALVVVVLKPFAQTYPQLAPILFFMLVLLGFLLIVTTGILYLLKKMVEQRLLITLWNARREIITSYISKVNANTVAADQVIELSDRVLKEFYGVEETHKE